MMYTKLENASVGKKRLMKISKVSNSNVNLTNLNDECMTIQGGFELILIQWFQDVIALSVITCKIYYTVRYVSIFEKEN